MSITTEIQRINGGKKAIRTLASKKNVNIPSTTLIDSYASVLGTQWPDCTFNVNYDGDKIRGKTMKWNQVSPVSEFSNEITDSKGRFDLIVQQIGGERRVSYSNSNTPLGYTYAIFTNDITGSFRIKHNGSVSDINIATVGLELNHKYLLAFDCLSNNPSLVGGLSLKELSIIDLTKNDLEDIASTSDPRVPFLIQYAKDHPDYDTGSLAYSFYKGTKLGEYDYIDTTNNKLVLGGAEVDISQMSLTRFLFGSNYLFYGTNNDQETNTTNVISADYQTAADITDIPDMSVTGNGGTGKTLWFRDDSCTTVEQFKAKNAGKKVYFKLATPTEIDL